MSPFGIRAIIKIEMRFSLLFAFLLTLTTASLSQARGGKTFSMYTHYNSYTDILNDQSNQPRELPEDISLGLDIRLKRIFILMIHGGSALDSSRSYWGLGFKVDLPGFFMLGGNVQEFIRKRKRKGVNTSLYWKAFVLSETNQMASSVGNRFGFSADFLITKDFFLNLDLGLYSDNGNQYFSPSAGLGYEF